MSVSAAEEVHNVSLTFSFFGRTLDNPCEACRKNFHRKSMRMSIRLLRASSHPTREIEIKVVVLMLWPHKVQQWGWSECDCPVKIRWTLLPSSGFMWPQAVDRFAHLYDHIFYFSFHSRKDLTCFNDLYTLEVTLMVGSFEIIYLGVILIQNSTKPFDNTPLSVYIHWTYSPCNQHPFQIEALISHKCLFHNIVMIMSNTLFIRI